MNKIISLVILLIISYQVAFSQISGNQLYGKNRSYYNDNKDEVHNSITSTDTTLIISSRILLNKKADYFLITLGVSHEEKTVKVALQRINKRIGNFRKQLASLGVKDGDVYIDFVAQTKIYDYDVEGNKINQTNKGFEVKKNIIIKLKDISKFEKVVELASEEDIYDIVKVDYKNNEQYSDIYNQLYNEAVKIISNKKDLILSTNNIKIKPKYVTLKDDFSTIFPKSCYKQYEAYESSDVDYYKDNYVKREMRKSKTFYYDAVNISQFDKVLNNDITDVTIQYTLQLSFIYQLEK